MAIIYSICMLAMHSLLNFHLPPDHRHSSFFTPLTRNSYGADARLKNRDGLTPCELAVMLKHNSVVACFATYVGAGLLGQLRKPQPNLTL